MYSWLARQLYSRKIRQPNIGTSNKLTGGLTLTLQASQPLSQYYSIALIPCKLPQVIKGGVCVDFFGRAAIRAADQNWLPLGYILALPDYHIVLHLNYKVL